MVYAFVEVRCKLGYNAITNSAKERPTEFLFSISVVYFTTPVRYLIHMRYFFFFFFFL